MKPVLNPSSAVVASRNQVSCELADEAVILSLKDGVYYGLDAVGAGVWRMLQQQRTVGEIRDTLLQEYEVEPEACERDVIALLQQMMEHELVVLTDATPS